MRVPITLLTVLLLSFSVNAQDSTKAMKLSIHDAIAYAMDNSLKAKTAEIDIEQAKKDVWIQASRGLPIVKGSVGYTNFIDLPTSIIPADAFGAPPGTPPIEAQFGQAHTMEAGVNVGLQIFDGSYIIGVKGAKGFEKLRADQSRMTDNEIETLVATRYYTSQIALENVRLLDQNIANIEKTLNETSKLYEAGFAEEMDVEQLDLLINGLKNKAKMAKRQHAATLLLIKYEIGMDVNTNIELTDNLETLWALESDSSLLAREMNMEANLAFDLVKQDVVLHGYLVKLEEAKYYPTLHAFFDYKQQAFRDKFDFFDFSRSWYPQTLWGIKLNVPIWDNLGGAASIKKAKLEQQKVKDRLWDLEQALTMQYITARDNFYSSLEQLDNAKANVSLAERIQNKTLIRYNEGLSSSMELTTAENQLIQAQTEYINTLFQAMDAKVDLKVAVDND